jgi:hypothetical protein
MQDIDLDFVRALSWVTCTKYALIGSAKLEFEGVESPSDCGIPGTEQHPSPLSMSRHYCAAEPSQQAPE